jgi:hypothetical protein
MKSTNIQYKLSSFLCTCVVLVAVLSCSKQDTGTLINFQRDLLSGKGTFQNTQRVWKIDSMYVNGAQVALTVLQKKYTKTFVYDGSYFDVDGIEGKWNIKELDNLTEYLYDTAGRYLFDSLQYHIDEINSFQFKCTLNSTKKIKYIYVIAP